MVVGQETQQRAGGEFGLGTQQGGVGLAGCTARFFVCPALAYIGLWGFLPLLGVLAQRHQQVLGNAVFSIR